jgi:hypothetical protein
MRTIREALVIVLSTILLLSTGTATLASTVDISTRYVHPGSGLAPDQIRARWEWVRQNKIAIFQRTGNWVAVENWLIAQGFKVVVSIREPNPGGDSVNSDAAYNTAVYYDPNTGQYDIEGTWQWNSVGAFQADFPFFCFSPCDVGGLEAGALWISNPTNITFVNGWMNTFDTSSALRTSTSTMWDWNQYGADFRNQDQAFWNGSFWDYTHYRGGVDLIASVPFGASGSTYVKLVYGHDWSSTGISSVSIGATDVSVTFSSTSNSWQAASPFKVWSYPCQAC